jgi:hypothetical protein|nr:MAG TPA: hypothetical protein [Caudoviricetes sp.]
MDRNQAKEFYPILQAYAEGKVIECRTKPSAIEGTDVPNDWTEMKEITYWSNIEYRIKPDSKTEAKYRPFKDAEECWTEMLKHQPFGWVKNKGSQALFVCKAIGKLIAIGFEDTPYTYKHPFDTYTFADGLPFGVKIEEK